MPVTVDKDTCIGCGACVGVCPVAALALDENGKSGCDEDTCISCFSCIPVCPVSAITERTRYKKIGAHRFFYIYR